MQGVIRQQPLIGCQCSGSRRSFVQEAGKLVITSFFILVGLAVLYPLGQYRCNHTCVRYVNKRSIIIPGLTSALPLASQRTWRRRAENTS